MKDSYRHLRPELFVWIPQWNGCSFEENIRDSWSKSYLPDESAQPGARSGLFRADQGSPPTSRPPAITYAVMTELLALGTDNQLDGEA